MTEHINEIPEAELYVIALGTNDVRYRDSSICSMTAEDYVDELDKIQTLLIEKNKDAEFVFIAPWYSTDGDPFCSLSFSEKTSLNEEYTNALEDYCSKNSFAFINANNDIKHILYHVPERKYLLDHIHPNANEGVIMYSEAVLLQ